MSGSGSSYANSTGRRRPRARITAAVRECFADSRIPEDAYAHLLDDMPSPDPGDRYHIAAAIAGSAAVLITWNRADFPTQPLARLGLRVADPDTYLQELLADRTLLHGRIVHHYTSTISAFVLAGDSGVISSTPRGMP